MSSATPGTRGSRMVPPPFSRPEKDSEGSAKRLAELSRIVVASSPCPSGDHRDAEVEQFVERHPPEQAVAGERYFSTHGRGAGKGSSKRDLGYAAFRASRPTALPSPRRGSTGLGGERKEIGPRTASVPCSFENFPCDDDGEFSLWRASAPLFQSEKIEKWTPFRAEPEPSPPSVSLGGEDQDAFGRSSTRTDRRGHPRRESVTSVAKDISTPVVS